MSTGAQDFVQFLTKAVSPYHSVQECRTRLDANGFVYLLNEERETWKLSKGGKYYTHMNQTAIVIFIWGAKVTEESSFVIAAAHTDSPVLRVRPKHNVVNNGYIQLACETYGGGLWHTWLDRELSAAGRVVYKRDGALTTALIDLEDPICFIPNLCIHLQNAEERSSLKLSTEKNMVPILQSQIQDDQDCSPLLKLISKKLNVDPQSIVDMDLSLYDANPPRIVGIEKEFLMGGRLDNQVSTYCITDVMTTIDPAVLDDVIVGVGFDHEEIGSASFTGADSAMLDKYIQLISKSVFTASLDSVLSRAFLLSVDGGHAVHPNYSEKHQKQHMVGMSKGMIIKTNENQRYTTNGLTRAIVKTICDQNGVKYQDYSQANDIPCGSTIGHFASSSLGIRALDCGISQLAMHSIREVMHISDLDHCKGLIRAVFKDFRSMDKNLTCL